ncbi:MAG: sigma-70 family RNA polymerase sigma factor [Longilinea sp.]|nr:sigma-70 family RNA polymerase sigma factor [Longilinea sp.]
MDKAAQTLSLAKLQAGDPHEFAHFVDQYSGSVYRLALKMVSEPQDAEDVLQETFLKAQRALPKFEGRSSLATWLYRIAVNEALMVLRKRRPDMISVEEPDPDAEEPDEPLQIIDWCCLPEAELLSNEFRQHLQAAMQQLSPALRAVFLLRDIEGLSIEETAQTLDVSQAVVKTRLLRARLKLREALSEYYKERLTERSQ